MSNSYALKSWTPRTISVVGAHPPSIRSTVRVTRPDLWITSTTKGPSAWGVGLQGIVAPIMAPTGTLSDLAAVPSVELAIENDWPEDAVQWEKDAAYLALVVRTGWKTTKRSPVAFVVEYALAPQTVNTIGGRSGNPSNHKLPRVLQHLRNLFHRRVGRGSHAATH